MAKVLVCGLSVTEFELQSNYYIHLRTNTLEKGMNLFIPLPAMYKMISVLFFYKEGFGIKQPMKVDMPLKIETKSNQAKTWHSRLGP